MLHDDPVEEIRRYVEHEDLVDPVEEIDHTWEGQDKRPDIPRTDGVDQRPSQQVVL